MDIAHCWGDCNCAKKNEPLDSPRDGKINERLGDSKQVKECWEDEVDSVNVGIHLERVFKSFFVRPVELDCFVWAGCSTASRSDEYRLICFL